MHKDKEDKMKFLNIQKERYLKNIYTFTPQVRKSKTLEKFHKNNL